MFIHAAPQLLLVRACAWRAYFTHIMCLCLEKVGRFKKHQHPLFLKMRTFLEPSRTPWVSCLPPSHASSTQVSLVSYYVLYRFRSREQYGSPPSLQALQPMMLQPKALVSLPQGESRNPLNFSTQVEQALSCCYM